MKLEACCQNIFGMGSEEKSPNKKHPCQNKGIRQEAIKQQKKQKKPQGKKSSIMLCPPPQNPTPTPQLLCPDAPNMQCSLHGDHLGVNMLTRVRGKIEGVKNKLSSDQGCPTRLHQ